MRQEGEARLCLSSRASPLRANLHAGRVKGVHGEGRHDGPLFQYSTEIADHQRVFSKNLKVLEQGRLEG